MAGNLNVGEEGRKRLTEKMVRQLGAKLLEEIQAARPDLKAYGVEKTGGFIAIENGGTGWLTEFIFQVRSQRIGLLSRLFPKILAVVHSDHGLMPYSRVEVRQPGIWEAASRIGRLAREFDFVVEKSRNLLEVEPFIRLA